MHKILRANFMRLRKDILFWGALLFSVAYLTLVCFNQYGMGGGTDTPLIMDNFAFGTVLTLGVILAIVMGLFMGTEYSDGTIRNKIIMGHSRTAIYHASFITCFVTGLIILFFSFFYIIGLGIMVFHWSFAMPATQILLYLVNSIFLCMSYAAIYTFVSLLSSSKANTAVLVILLSFFLLFIGIGCYANLSEPEMVEPLTSVAINGEVAAELIPNPYYISGTERVIYQFVFDFLPGGQGMQIGCAEVLHPYRMILYSMLITFFCNLLGNIFFRKKNMK